MCYIDRNSQTYNNQTYFKCDRQLNITDVKARVSADCGISNDTNDGTCSIRDIVDYLYPLTNNSIDP